MTTKKKKLFTFECEEIIDTWKCKKKEREIADILNHSKSTIHDIIYAYRNFSFETISPQSNRPHIMTKKDSHHLKKLLKENRWTNIHKLTDNFVDFTLTNVNTRTVKHYLHNKVFMRELKWKNLLLLNLIKKKDFYGLKNINIEKKSRKILFEVMSPNLNYLKKMEESMFGRKNMKNMIYNI